MSSGIKLIKELKKYIKNIKTLKEAKKVAFLLEDEYNIDLEEIVGIMDMGYESDKENEEIYNVIEESQADSESESESESDVEFNIIDDYDGDVPSLEELQRRMDEQDRILRGYGKNTDSDKRVRDSIKFIMSVKGLGNYVNKKMKGGNKKKWELHAIMLMKPLRKNGINKRLKEYNLLDEAKGRKIEDFPNRFHINILHKRLFDRFRSKKIGDEVNLVYGRRK